MKRSPSIHPMATTARQRLRVADFLFVGGTAMLMAVPFLFLALLAPADAETHTGQASLYQSSVTTICVADETPCAQVWYGSQ